MLRQRTLDVVEAIAAWHRRVGNPEPFVYYGNDYLANIGELSEMFHKQGVTSPPYHQHHTVKSSDIDEEERLASRMSESIGCDSLTA